MICNFCGKENPDGMKFCSACGSALPVIQAPTQPIAPQPMAQQAQTQSIAPQPVSPVIPQVKSQSSFDMSLLLVALSVFGSGIVIGIVSGIYNAIVNEIFGWTMAGMYFGNIITIVLRLAIGVGLSIPSTKELKDRLAFVGFGYAGSTIGSIISVFFSFVISLFDGNTGSGAATVIGSGITMLAGAVVAAAMWYVYKNGFGANKK